ncbi:MAG: ParB/RepB/Spo0J family partition protein [Chloroflexi bacterium]|nr:ParB/RepB/Spo0J family partition protein [Chloroflexota bacterium]
MSKQGGLGKGLASLLPDWQSSQFQEVAITAIERNPRQPRMRFEGLDELASSIRTHGVLQPLVVSKIVSTRATEPSYQLIAGERRLQAALLAGLDHVPAIIKETTEQGLLELALIENVQREDLNALEEAQAYKMLMDEFGFTQEQVAERVGKSRVAIANTLRLLRSSPDIRTALLDGVITEGHARALLALIDEAQVRRALAIVIERQLSVRETEELVRRLLQPPLEQSTDVQPVRDPRDVLNEEHLAAMLGARVRLHRSKRGGRLTIFFSSEGELSRLMRHLGASPERT